MKQPISHRFVGVHVFQKTKSRRTSQAVDSKYTAKGAPNWTTYRNQHDTQTPHCQFHEPPPASTSIRSTLSQTSSHRHDSLRASEGVNKTCSQAFLTSTRIEDLAHVCKDIAYIIHRCSPHTCFILSFDSVRPIRSS
jgi:hypothetical protein